MQIQTLTAETLPAFKPLAEQAWSRPRTHQYYQWRYFDAPGAVTLLAMEGGRCIATLSAFERLYRGCGHTVRCLEPFDWYSEPASRRTSAGLRLMKALFAMGKPVVGLGSMRYTLKLLPRAGYKAGTEATEFFLPLSSAYILRDRRLPGAVKRALKLPFDKAVAAWFTPAARPIPRLAFVSLSCVDKRLAAIDGVPGFRSVPDPDYFAWLQKGTASGARTGSYLILAANLGTELVGWSISRLYRSRGLLHAAMLDMRFKRPDAEIAETMVRATARALVRAGADDVRAVSTCGFLACAYRRAGFLVGADKSPATLWSGSGQVAPDRLAMSCVGDAAFQPLQEEPDRRVVLQAIPETRAVCAPRQQARA